MQIAIIDYGSGNIHSVQKALEFVAPNDNIIHTNDRQIIENADKIIFPGQGAMGSCMQKLKDNDLIEVIKNSAKTKPFLGVCLGLQMLFETSEEDNCDGLGIIKGSVKRFESSALKLTNSKLKIPHMGWNTVKQIDSPIWQGIKDNSYFYSVHSYFVQPKNKDLSIGLTNYGIDFTCAIADEESNKNLFAVQFHPEKSSDDGLQLLKNFVELKNS
jgi:glutamine amidotransferase